MPSWILEFSNLVTVNFHLLSCLASWCGKPFSRAWDHFLDCQQTLMSNSIEPLCWLGVLQGFATSGSQTGVPEPIKAWERINELRWYFIKSSETYQHEVAEVNYKGKCFWLWLELNDLSVTILGWSEVLAQFCMYLIRYSMENYYFKIYPV